MLRDNPPTIYLKDYLPPEFAIDQIELRFELGEKHTDVTSELKIHAIKTDGQIPTTLTLHGVELELLELTLNGEAVDSDRYNIEGETLSIERVPEKFQLKVVTRIYPQNNTSLEGLYVSNNKFCTQCEAEGFRKITYYPDRPDVMAPFTTTLVADKEKYPVLLSNGNLVEKGELEGGHHFATWKDPFKKPSYLFALVAGNLDCLEDEYTTISGRKVKLQLFVEPGNLDKTRHAMDSLKHAMQWDEQRFGLEYDLDIYMIVAVGDFNMGAMENKGLNIFNTAYVLAKPETATDRDYEGIEGVIAHEYFHNWTGNRVTCRDWFQLSLKEGLTVFRDQEFSADMGSAAVKRISDVRMLRAMQFAEDGGPMAHPVRPESYVEINNFYTVTVYEKGAEVVRMYQTLLGRDGFRKGMDLYFQRHDGQAVTTDDFRAAMADANDADLDQFSRWYSQAGTPMVEATGAYDAQAGSYSVRLRQTCPATPGQASKEPFHIPFALGLLDQQGNDIPLQLEGETSATGTTRVLEFRQAEQEFKFINVPSAPVPSWLRGFSAPVKMDSDLTNEQLGFLLANDSDPFNRWDAGQQFSIKILLQLMDDIENGRPLKLNPLFVEAMRKTLLSTDLDPALIAEALVLPGESYLIELSTPANPDTVHQARDFVRTELARSLYSEFLGVYEANHSAGTYEYNAVDAGHRSLKNSCLSYLSRLADNEAVQRCMQQYQQADNMTDALGAMAPLNNIDCPERAQVLQEFYDRWQGEALVINKWFSLQAGSSLPNAFQQVQELMKHPDFDIRNPNRVRSLVGAFSRGNPLRFHSPDGSGYRFIADQVLRLDALNPQVASRMVGVFNNWRKFEPVRQKLMKEQLERIIATPELSKDVHEIVSKALAA
jgi:aminopeptidase N